MTKLYSTREHERDRDVEANLEIGIRDCTHESRVTVSDHRLSDTPTQNGQKPKTHCKMADVYLNYIDLDLV